MININIFYLDQDIKKCAEYHTDKHIVKMLLEGVQLLCSTYYFTDNIPENIYKLSHKNHPCSIWVRESLSNWMWLYNLCNALYDEYKHRYNNKQHKSGELLKQLPIPNIEDKGITLRPQTMPDEYKNMNPVEAYRQYYNADKRHLFKWTKRNIPEWVIV